LAGLGGGHTYTLGGASSATCTWAYDFTAASNFEGTIPVTATDRATNPSTGSGQAPGTATFTLVRDGTPPAVAVTATVQAEDIHVTWAASDTGSDLGACRLEVDTGDGSQEELSTSCEGSYIYTDVEPGQTCIFHLTATDHVGNQASAEATSGLPRVTKYFYHGGKRVAMRSGGQAPYQLTSRTPGSGQSPEPGLCICTRGIITRHWPASRRRIRLCQTWQIRRSGIDMVIV
jgi:hypothetical protein